jgi:hypothetical protein
MINEWDEVKNSLSKRIEEQFMIKWVKGEIK